MESNIGTNIGTNIGIKNGIKYWNKYWNKKWNQILEQIWVQNIGIQRFFKTSTSTFDLVGKNLQISHQPLKTKMNVKNVKKKKKKKKS